MPEETSIVINGWTVFCHPLFLDELDTLIKKVEELKGKDPINYQTKNATKRLAAISSLAFDVIPRDPSIAKYRQGISLGDEHKHWFRAKFFQQYRLFFRYDSASKIIVFVWVNDDKHKRSYGSKTDAYRVFKKMLKSGDPPDSWDQLLKEAKGDLSRLYEITKKGLKT